MVKVTSLLIKARSGHGCSFGVRAWTEMEIWYVKSVYMLKVISSKKILGFKGILYNYIINLNQQLLVKLPYLYIICEDCLIPVTLLF